jgi:RHS repeat-associated protein
MSLKDFNYLCKVMFSIQHIENRLRSTQWSGLCVGYSLPLGKGWGGVSTLVFDVNDHLEYILFTEGRILHDAGSFTYEYHLKDHLGSTRVAFVPNGNTATVTQEIAYYPGGAPIAALSYFNPSLSTNRYMREGKEYLSDFLWNKYDYGWRAFCSWSWRSLQIDPMAEKFPWLSPYAFCANNPLKFIDPTGMEIDVAELYRKNKDGSYVYAQQVKSFEAYANTKGGQAELAKYAKAGQEMAGIKFDKDGAYHTKGVDVAFNGSKDLKPGREGQCGAEIVDGRLKIDIATRGNNDIGQGVETIAHEMLIHGRQDVKDFSDNGKLDYSHISKEIYKHAENLGDFREVHHWQEGRYDKVMEKVAIPILREYYKSIGVTKSQAELLQMVTGYWGFISK